MLGEKLIKLRKEKNLSQEEVANILNVSRQTVSKWETDMSTPDFDKIVPICELYGITTEELLKNESKPKVEIIVNDEEKLRRKTLGLVIGVLLYFVSLSWIIMGMSVFKIQPEVVVSIFMLICGIATITIIYTSILYKTEKKEKKKNTIIKRIDNILSLLTVILYLFISFTTGMWHITWLIWILYVLVIEVIKLVFSLKGVEYEE